MNKKQFFLGIILASLIGGVIALAGASYLIKPNSASNFTDKQDTSLVNWLSDEKFNVPDGINFVASAAAVTPAVVHVKSSVTVSQNQRGSDPFEEFFIFEDENIDDDNMWNHKYSVYVTKGPLGIMNSTLVEPTLLVGNGIRFIRNNLQSPPKGQALKLIFPWALAMLLN